MAGGGGGGVGEGDFCLVPMEGAGLGGGGLKRYGWRSRIVATI
mgnify:CR=1 FL=1